MLEAEKPDLVLLTGDQAHHDHSDTKSIIFKLVASLISRSIPYAIVFGNHDDEGAYALSRTFSNFIGDASDWRSTKGYGDTASQATPTPLLCESTAQSLIMSCRTEEHHCFVKCRVAEAALSLRSRNTSLLLTACT